MSKNIKCIVNDGLQSFRVQLNYLMYCIYFLVYFFFFPIVLGHRHHVEVVTVDFRYGPLRSEANCQPL